MSEKCQRCGEDGADRRTLWMACFYDMGELGLPFKHATLFHANKEELLPANPPSDLKLDDKTSIRIQSGTVTTSGELYPQQFFTMRVCKNCRSNWMRAIRDWFKTQPESDEGLEAGAVYVRELGANKRIA